MLTKDYVIPSLAGRMGNHMFMIAHAYAKALEYNKQFVIARDQTVDGNTGHDYKDHIFRKIETIEKFEDNGNWGPIPSDDKHTQYAGYFQSEKHFKKYSEAIKTLYAPPLEFIERIKNEIPSIFHTKVTVISVRRGDYLFYPNYHPVVSIDYIHKAIQTFIPHTDNYIIMSDDIPWCKLNIRFPSLFLEGYLPQEQMWIMSMCHQFVISNSSFSWWGAYLSRYENKIVVAPETWFGPEGPQAWQDIYCEGWKILPTYFNNGIIEPK